MSEGYLNPFIPEDVKVYKVTYVQDRYALMRVSARYMEMYGKPLYIVVEFYPNRMVIYPFLSALAAKRAIKRYIEKRRRRMQKSGEDYA